MLFFQSIDVYTQTTREKIFNERDNIAPLIESDQFDSIILLIPELAGLEYLSLVEKELILLLQNEYIQLAGEIIKNEKDFLLDGLIRTQDGYEHPESPFRYILPIRQNTVTTLLVNQFHKKKELLKSDIHQSDISREKKMFLIYYIDFVDYQLAICDEYVNEKVIESGKKLTAEFPATKYRTFIEKYTKRYRTHTTSFGVSTGVGGSTLTHGLSEYMSGGLSIFMNIEYSFKNFQIATHLNLITTTVDNYFEGVLTPYEEGRKASFNSLGLRLGYEFQLGDWIIFTPFAGYFSTTFQGLYNSEEEAETLNFRRVIGSNFYYGANIDFNLKPSGCHTGYIESIPFARRKTNFMIRLQLGVLTPNLNKTLTPLTGNVLYYGIGIAMKFNSKSGKKVSY